MNHCLCCNVLCKQNGRKMQLPMPGTASPPRRQTELQLRGERRRGRAPRRASGPQLARRGSGGDGEADGDESVASEASGEHAGSGSDDLEDLASPRVPHLEYPHLTSGRKSPDGADEPNRRRRPSPHPEGDEPPRPRMSRQHTCARSFRSFETVPVTEPMDERVLMRTRSSGAAGV